MTHQRTRTEPLNARPTSTPATILYLHASDDHYGADVILLQIVRELDRTRFHPIVVLPEDMRHIGLLSKELTQAGIEWVHLPIAIVRRRYLKPKNLLPFLNSLMRGTLAVGRLARSRNAQLIHGFTFAVVAAPLAALALRLPLIMQVHEILERPVLIRKLLHSLYARSASAILCVSEATRGHVLSDQPRAASRLKRIYNGIAPLPAPCGTRSEVRAALGVPSDRPLIGMMGRVSAWKGQDIFLRAAARVRISHPACHFIAIGGVFDGDVERWKALFSLRQSLGLEDAVTLCGFRKDARDLLFAMDIFVLPSTAPDPFPTVILEAMSAGLPVIASAHGGPLEMVLDGQTGLLVPPADPAALAVAIQRLLDHPTLGLALGASGRTRMLQHFEHSRYLEEVQQLYEQVLCRHDAAVSGPLAEAQRCSRP